MPDEREVAQLVQRVKDGDDDALTSLYDLHAEALMAFVKSRLLKMQQPMDDAVDDICQATWTGVVKGLVRFRVDAKFSTWLNAIAENQIATYLTKKGRSIAQQAPLTKEGKDTFWAEAEDRSRGLLDAASRTDLGERLQKLIGTLSPDLRQVFILRQLEGLDNEAIAELLGVHENTVTNRWNRAAGALQSQLGDFTDLLPREKATRR